MVKHNIALRVSGGIGAAALFFALAGPAAADDKLNIVFTHHSSASNPFWQAVKKGFDDACAKIQANCQMVFTQTEGSVDQEVANQAGCARAQARRSDHDPGRQQRLRRQSEGSQGEGGDRDRLERRRHGRTGTPIASGLCRPELCPRRHDARTSHGRSLPKEGPIRVLVGVNAPGQNWSEQRAKGIMNGLEEFKKANPNREITIDRLDVSADGAIVSDRVGAYPQRPSGYHRLYRDRALAFQRRAPTEGPQYPAGQDSLGGFDLAPQVIEQMKAGYIQVEIDQQPYEQGFLPVMQVYLEKKVGLAPSHIDSGEAVFTPEQADQLMGLAKQGLR